MTQAQDQVQEITEVYEGIKNLYVTYLNELEKIADAIPETDTEALQSLYEHIQEVSEAANYDMNLFKQAVKKDRDILEQLKK